MPKLPRWVLFVAGAILATVIFQTLR